MSTSVPQNTAEARGSNLPDNNMPAPDTENLISWDTHHVWHAFTQMQEYESLLLERGEGCWLIDTSGKKYLDGSASMWCNVHGHGHPRLNAAIIDQLHKVAHTTNLGLSNPTTVEFAHRLTQITPAGLEHVFFSDDGSTAIEAALKIAFQFWLQTDPARPRPKQKYVAIGDAYHGDTLGAIGVGGVDRFTSMFMPLTFESIRIPSPSATSSSPDKPHLSCNESLAYLEQVFNDHSGDISAMIMEPMVQAAGGILVHPPGFLAGVRKLTQKHDILLILDEVATGFGRTGSMFACEQENVVPDILCIAKGLTAGYLPMAATLTNNQIWSAFLGSSEERRTFYHGHTYGGNPLAAAAGIESLNLFRDENVLAQMPAKIDRLRQHVCRIEKLKHVGDARQCGLMAGFELMLDKTSQKPFPWQEQRGSRACRFARNHNVLLRPLGDVVVIMPPLSISLDEIDMLAEATEKGIIEATT